MTTHLPVVAVDAITSHADLFRCGRRFARELFEVLGADLVARARGRR